MESLTLDKVWWEEQADGSYVLCFTTTTSGLDHFKYLYKVCACLSGGPLEGSGAWDEYSPYDHPGTHSFCSVLPNWPTGETKYVRLYRRLWQAPYTAEYIISIPFTVPSLPTTKELSIILSSPPQLSLHLRSMLRILHTISLQPLPSLSVSLQLIGRFLSEFTLKDLPALLISLELLPFPHDVLTDTIVAENARAVAEGAFEHARRLNVSGYTQPPFFCFICGKTFNNHDDFITHLISHVQAYEENNYE